MSSGIAPELRWHAIGRRKVGIARVYLTPGSGKWNVNGRTLGDYFPRPSLVSHIQQPFVATDTLGAFDVKGICSGGGNTGQAGAMRLAIARALVGNPRILIFDEATSALDYESEAIIQHNLAQICRGRTVFLIAHRLSTVRAAHCIVVIDKGCIVEHGTHAELLERRGYYAKLHAHQDGHQYATV